MAEAAHLCGDPGIQYDTTINDWHTSAATAPIYASNPCSEYMFLNDTACNLASMNLMKFVKDDGEFDIDAYRYAARLTITAQEILVDNASYPTPQIEENSHRYRPLGIGYANLGALLMSRGLAYDSDEGRAYAATLTALMTGEAYRQSAVIARDHGGAFSDYARNESSFLKVIAKHRDASYQIPESDAPADLIASSREVWEEALALGTPVVTSDGSSLTEVAGDAALLVDPYSVDSIAWAIRAIDADIDLRRELVERGRQQAKKFSPGAYDDRLRQLYEKL